MRTVTCDGLLKPAEVLYVDVVRITYTVGVGQPIHPDPQVVSRMREIGLSEHCGHGCKIYADPLSSVRVLAHNSAYGCRVE